MSSAAEAAKNLAGSRRRGSGVGCPRHRPQLGGLRTRLVHHHSRRSRVCRSWQTFSAWSPTQPAFLTAPLPRLPPAVLPARWQCSYRALGLPDKPAGAGGGPITCDSATGQGGGDPPPLGRRKRKTSPSAAPRSRSTTPTATQAPQPSPLPAATTHIPPNRDDRCNPATTPTPHRDDSSPSQPTESDFPAQTG